MNYLLAILTCGRPKYLERTLASFVRFLDPAPSAVYVWDDGASTPVETFGILEGDHLTVEGEPERIGRCAGHAKLWEACRRDTYAGLDWVFTAEDDVVLVRPTPLNWLRELLQAEVDLQQVALVRCPWGAEIEWGGYFAQFPWKYERRETQIKDGPVCRWTASTVDWTSSPALLPMSLPLGIDWPAEPGCELTLGPRIQAAAKDAVSGYWGWGEPWCAHIGLDRIPGGHGY